MDNSDQLLQSLRDLVVEEMKQQVRIMGHTITGDLVESVEGIIEETITGATISIYLNKYGMALDQGVTPAKIPFTDPSGRGGKSLYIEGLTRFAELKLGLTDNKEALSAAFAIAKAHKMKGMPLSGPSQFIQATIDATREEVETFIEQYAEAVFEAKIDLIIQKTRA